MLPNLRLAEDLAQPQRELELEDALGGLPVLADEGPDPVEPLGDVHVHVQRRGRVPGRAAGPEVLLERAQQVRAAGVVVVVVTRRVRRSFARRRGRRVGSPVGHGGGQLPRDPTRVGPEPQYDVFADEFLAHAGDGFYNAHDDRPACLELLGGVAGVHVLDAACGPGLYAEELVRRGARVGGCDQSPRMIELFRERVPGADARVHDLNAPLDRVPGGSDAPDGRLVAPPR